jgi:NADPH-dependent glutamate synthase beta subunit-like oxidoreductase
MSAATPSPCEQPLAGYAIAVIGAATAGAEVAGRLAEAGARVVVFEQNRRPYGKIEDGLPRWHAELRRKEYRTIDAKLSQPGVSFVPDTRVGRDVSFEALCREWGFHAVVLANGAWRDRPLPIEGAEQYVGKGLVYQNPFIIWFNHLGEKDWQGATFEPTDGVLVVGGGLASIDVAKVLMLETTRAKLRERGIEAPLLELEVKGIPKVLERHGLKWEDLGLEGCTLFYRRRLEDMPLVEMPDDVTPERAAKVEGARKKLLEKAIEKYRFRVEPLAAPDGLVVEDGRLVGLRFRRTKMEGGKPVMTDETFERRGAYVISSIGSIPEPIPGIATKGELFAFDDWNLGRFAAHPTVFSAGNVVTGKGNIVASRKHATHVALHMHNALLDNSRKLAESVAEAVAAMPPHDATTAAALEARVRARQDAVGYPADYAIWIARVTPPDLE